jgi:initiation factor 1A
MVKNKTGGNRAKKGARKNLNESFEPRHLRFIEDKDEHYAIVTKMLGNGQVQVLCDDDKERLCMIRYKFSGRNKSRNLLSNGSWCIIGLRDWQTTKKDKLEICDLIEIYSHNEAKDLIQQCDTNLTALIKHENGALYLNEESNNVVDFVETQPIQEESIMKMGSDISNSNDSSDLEIDFDEI